MLPSAWDAWSSAAAAAAQALGILAACGLVGYSLLPRRVRRWGRGAAVFLALSLGALALGWSVWVVGAVAGTTPAVVVAGLLALQSLRCGRAFARAVRSLGRHFWRLGRAHPGLAALLAAAASLVAIQAALPVVDSDGLRYHLALPKLFLLEGRVTFYRYDVVGGFPQAAEMLYLLGLRLGAGESAKWLHAMFFVGSIAVLAAVVHRGRRTRGPAVLAGLAFAASPVALAPAGAAFVDHVALFHLAVGAWLASRRRETWAGLPLAAAAVTKVTAWPAVLVTAAAALLSRRRRRPRWAAVAVLLPMVAAWLPFGLRNVRATGDPFFPVGYALLGRSIPGLAEGAWRYATQFNAAVGGFLGIAWGETLAVQADEIVGWHHLLGLASLVVAFRSRPARGLAAVVLGYGIVGLWFHPPSRYLLPALWALAGCEGMAVARLPGRAWLRLAAAVCLPAAVLAGRTVTTMFAPWRYLGGELEREAFLAASVPGYRAARLASQWAASGRIMALDFPAPFYLDRPWIAEGILLDPPLVTWLRAARSGDDLLDRLQREHVSLLLVTPGFGGGTPRSLLALARDPREAKVLAELRRHLELVATADGVDVYRVPGEGPPRQ